jgi:TRAP-type C4-dicarboxylate transport system permease small subunit
MAQLRAASTGGRINRVFGCVDKAAQRLTQALLVSIICVVSAQAFCRFVLNQSLIWSEEVSAWCMVWVVFIGAIPLMSRDGMVSIPIFVMLLPPAARAVAVIISRAAALAACLFLAWYGVMVVTAGFNLVSQATGLNTRYIKFCVPLGAAVMALLAAVNLATDATRMWRGGGKTVAVPGAQRPDQPPPEAGAKV